MNIVIAGLIPLTVTGVSLFMIRRVRKNNPMSPTRKKLPKPKKDSSIELFRTRDLDDRKNGEWKEYIKYFENNDRIIICEIYEGISYGLELRRNMPGNLRDVILKDAKGNDLLFKDLIYKDLKRVISSWQSQSHYTKVLRECDQDHFSLRTTATYYDSVKERDKKTNYYEGGAFS